MSSRKLENQIAILLRTTNEQFATSSYISKCPSLKGKKNFDPTIQRDSFYKNVCNVFFHDGLLILSSLLDEKDARVIGLWNWKEFIKEKQVELKQITEDFKDSQLYIIRNQIVAHQDKANHSNNFPDSRRRGIIDPDLIDEAVELMRRLIELFQNFTRDFSTPYSEQYFEVNKALGQIKDVMESAPPALTDSHVI